MFIRGKRKDILNPGSGSHAEGLCHAEKAPGQAAASTDFTWRSGINAQLLGAPVCPQDSELLGTGTMSHSPLFPCA